MSKARFDPLPSYRVAHDAAKFIQHVHESGWRDGMLLDEFRELAPKRSEKSVLTALALLVRNGLLATATVWDEGKDVPYWRLATDGEQLAADWTKERQRTMRSKGPLALSLTAAGLKAIKATTKPLPLARGRLTTRQPAPRPVGYIRVPSIPAHR